MLGSGKGMAKTWVSALIRAKENITVVVAAPPWRWTLQRFVTPYSNGESITEIADRFGVSRGWIHKWVYPVLLGKKQRKAIKAR